MNRATEDYLKMSLTKAIEGWLETVASQEERPFQMPYLGDNIAEIMAQAALTSIRALVDAQEYMQENGLLVD